MKELFFETYVNATPGQVWETIWNPDAYAIWAGKKIAGARYEGAPETATTMKFFDGDNNGMYSTVVRAVKDQEVVLVHKGWIYGGELSPQDFGGTGVHYLLEPSGAGTLLKITVKTKEEFEKFHQAYYPDILQFIKQIAEKV